MQVTDSLPAENRAKQLKQKPWVIFSFYHNFFMTTITLCPNGTVPGIKMAWVKIFLGRSALLDRRYSIQSRTRQQKSLLTFLYSKTPGNLLEREGTPLFKTSQL